MPIFFFFLGELFLLWLKMALISHLAAYLKYSEERGNLWVCESDGQVTSYGLHLMIFIALPLQFNHKISNKYTIMFIFM